MHILFTRFPLESALGGAEIQTLSLMEGLMKDGHTVAFAGSCPVLLAECRKRKIPTTELQIGKSPVTKWEVISFAWRKKKMRATLKTILYSHENEKSKVMSVKNISKLKTHDSRPEVIVMLSLSEKLLLTDVAADAGIKVIWVEHDRVGNWLSKNPWLPLLLKQSAKATTVTVSKLSKQIYVHLGWNAHDIVTIPNGVERKATNGKRKPADGKLHLGCIARLSYEKGIDLLIDAMADVPNDIVLEIIGTGREHLFLKHLSQRLGLADRITFTTHEADIGAAFARWDALVLPSRDNDPFGMVAAEAMLAGLPVIVTDQCGIAGYLHDGKDAIVVKAESSAALADAIKEVGSRSEELGENGRKTAEKHFSVERMVEEYEKVFAR